MGSKKEIEVKWKIMVLIIILLVAAGVRFYFFSLYKNQPVWWDESEHLVMAKHLAFGSPLTGWNKTREILLPLIFAFFLKLFHSEVVLRAVQLTISFLVVLLTYFVGKEFFDEPIGLVAALGMAVFPEFLFWSLRFGLESIGLLFSLLTIFFFWKGYIKKERNYFLYISGALAALSIMANAKESSILLSLFFLIFFKERFRFLKDKELWITLLVFIATLTPFVLYYYNSVGHPLPRLMTTAESVQLSLNKGGWNWAGLFSYVAYLDNYLNLPFFALFLVGVVFLFTNLIFELDFIFKSKEKKYLTHSYLLLLFWITLPITTFSYFMAISPGSYFDPRMILESFPAIFMIVGLGSVKIYDWIKVYKKEIGIIVVLLLLLTGSYFQIKVASALISSKSNSYSQVKDAALWMKENSQPGDWIITASSPQTTYYAERPTIGPPKTEEEFKTLVKKLKPKFLVMSVFESHPEWYARWFLKNKEVVQPVKAYVTRQGSRNIPILVVYTLKDYNLS